VLAIPVGSLGVADRNAKSPSEEAFALVVGFGLGGVDLEQFRQLLKAPD
jgi:hypothetical protein